MADKIIDNLYLGTWEDGLVFDGETLNVRDGEGYHNMTFYLSMLIQLPDGWPQPFCVDVKKLEMAVDIVEWRLSKGKKLLVHCLMGKERSVLVVTHYLVRAKVCANLDGAYAFVKNIRPIIDDRRAWVKYGST